MQQNSLPYSVANVSTESTPLPTVECTGKCLDQIDGKIYEATASLRIASPVIKSLASESSAEEHYISFGGGSNATDDWADVTGLQIYIDSSKYNKLKNVVFEATMYIPTGNEKAYVRLFNVTDKHPVWFSEVSLEGGQSQLLVSSPITLDAGNKLYQVQMKTSLKHTANLIQARVHITTD